MNRPSREPLTARRRILVRQRSHGSPFLVRAGRPRADPGVCARLVVTHPVCRSAWVLRLLRDVRPAGRVGVSRWRTGLIMAVLLTIVRSAALDAQPRGGVTGVLLDESGGAIEGGRITIVDDGGFSRAITTTKSDGSFAASGLPVGHYRIQAESGLVRYRRRTGGRSPKARQPRLSA